MFTVVNGDDVVCRTSEDSLGKLGDLLELYNKVDDLLDDVKDFFFGKDEKEEEQFKKKIKDTAHLRCTRRGAPRKEIKKTPKKATHYKFQTMLRRSRWKVS